jgi:DNA invertase Pin-like site-specific DNA recombinase
VAPQAAVEPTGNRVSRTAIAPGAQREARFAAGVSRRIYFGVDNHRPRNYCAVMKRAIAYLRVSGLGQVDKDGEQRQSEAIHAFCNRHGLHYSEQRFEKGVSGTVEALDRPAFREVLELIARSDEDWDRASELRSTDSDIRKANWRPCIVVERMDRLARDLMVQELLLRECRERGVEVYAADQPFLDQASNDGDPTRKLFRQIMGALAEWEKSALVLKLRKARDRKRVETGRCEGQLPFHLTPQGQIVLERICSMQAAHFNVPQIVERLNGFGLTTCNGKPWTKRAVCHIVQKSKGQRK